MGSKVKGYSLFSEFDIELFAAGKHFNLFEKFGSHIVKHEGDTGCYFSVYAPAAKNVEVIGDFNYWDGSEYALNVRWDGSGIWEGFIPKVENGQAYKYRIYSNHDNKVREKADPYARQYEMPPKTASIVCDKSYKWADDKWIKERGGHNSLEAPISVYEVHLGSWRKNNEGYSLSYIEMANSLVDYVVDMGFSHVEFLPVMEHPYYPSWGYLSTGYFAPTSRYGNPNDFKYLVDKFHEGGVGVILDWVPAHFPSDEHALADFDGSQLYEHPDRSKGFHPDWNSLIFNFERPQIQSYLISSAHFWCKQFHIDGLRVDAVASMIYLDYSRKADEWSPNVFGSNIYLASVEMLKELNKSIYSAFPDVQMIAEESTAFDGVTRPVHNNGLGFGLKWMMGWMNDTLEYFSKDPIHRKYHHHEISRSLTYAFSENYILPLSHDEVVHGKQSLLSKMPGDEWQRFANLRLLYTYMFTHPGQKLLFMGDELAQTDEWDVNKSLPWHLLDQKLNKGIQEIVKQLNAIYKRETSLFNNNYVQSGFEWIDYSDNENTILAYIRKGEKESVVVILNFSPVVRNDYRVGMPSKGLYKEIFNSDAEVFGGGNVVNRKAIKAEKIKMHNREWSCSLTIPPLAGIVLKLK
jgi:1,4-alpha-glucan branching enzyme